jgi:hypothetical protein
VTGAGVIETARDRSAHGEAAACPRLHFAEPAPFIGIIKQQYQGIAALQ